MTHQWRQLLRRKVTACMGCGMVQDGSSVWRSGDCASDATQRNIWDKVDANIMQSREWARIAEGSYLDLR